MSVSATDTGTARGHHVLPHWPSALGLAAAALQLATGVNRDTVAITVTVATLCYLGAAATSRPWVAWAGIPAGSAVVVVSELADLTWWAGVGIAALALAAIGLLRGASRPAVTAQTLALVGYGGLAVVALFIAPRVGLVLAGVALASHAVWDLEHYRRNQVVPRSLSEFCMLLDVPLGVGAIVLAIMD